jgi:pyrroline-5-carboxylate reductase
MKLGFIGCGKMATALIKGVLASGLCTKMDIVASDTHAPAAQQLSKELGITTTTCNADVVKPSDVIVLAVKPDDALAAVRSLPSRAGGSSSGRLLISIVAGLSIRELEKAARNRFRVIRVMPNTPALVLAGASAFAPGSRATASDTEVARKLFSAVGLAVQVKEDRLDAVTGLSGSGPAFVYKAIEALADGGVLMGLPRTLALQLAAKTVAGAAAMVLDTGSHPAVLCDQVASPGGTTIAGLEALEKCGLRAALISAVRAATERSRQLGSAR